MSHQALRWALQVSSGGGLPPAAFALLILLADHHNPQHGCFPSQETLSKRLGMTDRGLRKNLSLLRRAGLVRVVCRGRRNGYVLNMQPSDTGTTVPLVTGTTVPVANEKSTNTGTTVPVVYITCKSEEDLTSKVNVVKTEFDDDLDSGKLDQSFGDAFVEGETAMKASDICAEIMAPKSEAEVLDRFINAEAKYGKVTGTMLSQLWIGLHGVHLPKLQMGVLINKQRAQLKSAHKQAGSEFAPALASVLRHWADFVEVAKMHGGHLKPSEFSGQKVPNTGFVLKNIQAVVVFHREKKLQSSSNQAAPPAAPYLNAPGASLHTLLKPTVSGPAEVLPTLAEAMAILNGTGDEA